MDRAAVKKQSGRGILNEIMIIAGALLLLWAALTSLKPVLAVQSLPDGRYFVTGPEIRLPLPQLASVLNTGPVEEDVFSPLLYRTPTPTPSPTPTPTPTPVPSAGPVVRLVIPRLDIDRAVVPLKQQRDSSGRIRYDTAALFATSSRSDLVGQVATSVNPGDGSNIVLVGHNYNRGWYAWEGVFVDLHKLKTGDKVVLFTENGDKHTYQVKRVKEIPWSSKTNAEIQKHSRYLGPSAEEKVTLMTCGGVFGVWGARVYVVAK